MHLQRNSFYDIIEFESSEAKLRALCSINPAHDIFKGHFPNQPVVPGVCMLQMIKELAEKSLQKKLRLEKASQIKYLQLLVPNAEEPIAITLDWKEALPLQFNASFQAGAITIMKMTGSFSD